MKLELLYFECGGFGCDILSFVSEICLDTFDTNHKHLGKNQL